MCQKVLLDSIVGDELVARVHATVMAACLLAVPILVCLKLEGASCGWRRGCAAVCGDACVLCIEAPRVQGGINPHVIIDLLLAFVFTTIARVRAGHAVT